jgi:hypothetical protein
MGLLVEIDKGGKAIINHIKMLRLGIVYYYYILLLLLFYGVISETIVGLPSILWDYYNDEKSYNYYQCSNG